MKVSVNISTEQGPNGFAWSSILKFKAHSKTLVSDKKDFQNKLLALKNAVKVSLDSIKNQCTIDVYTSGLGSSDNIRTFLETSNEMKKAYPHHIIKFYAS